jgi:A/G-specific adenine glycosylase
VTTYEFQKLIQEKGHELYRPMPWREDIRPYYVLVSELMLQQTQVDRVVPKFNMFIRRFPNEIILAQATLSKVLELWNGLGYNRRAKFLHDAAKKIVDDFNGVFPSTKDMLLMLPGVGSNTAGAIMNYAYNKPTPFIETNIRTVYFYHFFKSGDKVSDAEILPLLEATIDTDHPREFYWALMDYGNWLKKQKVGNIQQSRHYKKQPALKGSVREVRGQIIRQLMQGGKTENELQKELIADERFSSALLGLLNDGLIMQTKGIFYLTK